MAIEDDQHPRRDDSSSTDGALIICGLFFLAVALFLFSVYGLGVS